MNRILHCPTATQRILTYIGSVRHTYTGTEP